MRDDRFAFYGSRNLRWTWLASEVGSLIVTAAIMIGFHYGVKPRIAPVQPNDLYRYAYYHKPKQILPDAVIIGVIVASIVVVAPFLLALRYVKSWSWKNLIDDIVVFLLAYLNGNVLTLTITEILKKAIGRPRPDFLSRCLDTVDPVVIGDYIASHQYGAKIDNCKIPESSKFIQDGRMSFPSGHSSGSCFAFLFISLWIFERLGPYRKIGFVRVLLPIYVAIFPAFVMVSRVMDNRHNPLDVLAGGTIGVIMAVLTFRFYYPLHFKPLARPPSWPSRTTSAAAPVDDCFVKISSATPDKGDYHEQVGIRPPNYNIIENRPPTSTEATGHSAA